MKVSFEHLLQTRKNIIKVLEAFKEKAHIIPTGFSNNLFWNAAHCIATQQLLCYGLSGLEKTVPDKFIEKYRKGSQPGKETVSEEEYQQVIHWLIESLEKMKVDYENGKFKEFKEYPTSFGVTLSTIEEAIQFNTVHESLHLGYMMAMRKML